MISPVRSSRFPYLPVHVIIGHPLYPDFQLDIEAYVNTGFDGGLVVPLGLIPDRVRSFGKMKCHLADGSEIEAPFYRGWVSVGAFPPMPAMIMTLLDRALLGLAITNHHRLSFHYGRQVVLEP
ncbi:MAG: hypothetical protein U0893_18240 [Chloroflexota bacterium]